jgi:hypothetical protein
MRGYRKLARNVGARRYGHVTVFYDFDKRVVAFLENSDGTFNRGVPDFTAATALSRVSPAGSAARRLPSIRPVQMLDFSVQYGFGVYTRKSLPSMGFDM